MNPPYALQVFPDVGRVLNFLLRAAIVILFPVLLLGLKIYNQLVYKRRPFLDDLFARELAAELAQVQPQSGDIIVLHSANFAMLEALFLLRPHLDLEAPYPCAVHAVFHHSMTERYGESFNLDYYQRAELTWLHRRLEVGFPFVALHLYATNEGLCRELSTLTGLQFNVFNHIDDLSKFGREIELAQFRTADTKAPRVGVRAKDVSKDNGAALSVALTRVRSAVPGAVFVVLGERGGDGIELQRLLSAVPGCVTVSTESDRDYLSEIRQLDILIQPYRPADYEKRISAVFVECALLGVSTVSPAGTTMAASTALAHVRSFEDLADLGAVIERTLADRAAADFGATRARHMAGAQAFYLRNAVSHDFVPEREPTVRIAAFGPIAALVTPFWGRCGSSTVFDSNTEYLLSRGYFVFRMMLSKDRVGIGSLDTIFKFYDENGRRVRAHVMLLASRTRRSLIRALATPSFWRESVFGQINRLNGFATDHDPALAAFAYRNAELVIVNHSFNVDYTRRFAKAKVVLETQDIQAHQLAVQKARNLLVFRQDSEAEFLRDEIEVWRSVAATVNLSPTENAFIARYCPIARYIRPYIMPRSIDPRRGWHDYVTSNRLDPRFLKIEHIDLLLWGDSHPLNVESTLWFLDEVMGKDERFDDTVVVICGRLGYAVREKTHWWENVYFAGYLDSLDECFARARLLVLPDQHGTGMSIKTLETLSIGMPFVATDIAMRGIEFGDMPRTTSSSAQAMRDEIFALLASDEERERRAAQARRMFELNFAPEVYYQHWDEVLSSIDVRPPEKTQSSTP